MEPAGGGGGFHLRLTIYDLRFTIYDLEIWRVSDSRNCEALAKGRGGAMMGGGSNGAGIEVFGNSERFIWVRVF